MNRRADQPRPAKYLIARRDFNFLLQLQGYALGGVQKRLPTPLYVVLSGLETNYTVPIGDVHV
jgi:hypothetical protein